MKTVKVVLVILVLFLCGFKAYQTVCKRCGAAEECLARGHEWYFKEVTFRKGDGSGLRGSLTAYYIWICDECRVTLAKCPAELTHEEETAISSLNHDGQMRIFCLKGKGW